MALAKYMQEVSSGAAQVTLDTLESILQDPRLITLPLVEETLRLEGLEESYVYQFIVYFENSAGRSQVSAPVQIRMPSSGIHNNTR